jgi:hypothetical protein
VSKKQQKPKEVRTSNEKKTIKKKVHTYQLLVLAKTHPMRLTRATTFHSFNRKSEYGGLAVRNRTK